MRQSKLDHWGGLLDIAFVEARNLPKMDVNGKADPFCVAKLGEKPVHTTKVIKKTLDPVWNETARVLIPTSQLNYNLDIEVWDWDKVSSNDFAGIAVLDLSTLHPKQPVDVWLPIKREHKHKQKTYGEVHIKAQMYTKPEVEAMFWRGVMDHFDTNKSGSIGHLELIGLLDGIGSSLTDEEIETLFDEFDENKDGEISFDELLKLVTDESARSNDLVSKMLPVDEDFIWTITAQAHDGTTIGSLVVNNNWNAEIEFRGSDGKKKKVSKIMVHDRATGKLVEEKIPHYIKVSMRVMYATGGGKRAVDMKRTQKILKSLTTKQGKKYNSPTSVRDIAPFIQYHQLSEDEMLDPVSSFANFNEFFYRKLKPSARTIAAPNDPKVAVSPADCRLNAFPKITSATELWIKGKNFSLASLLQNSDLAAQYEEGSMAICRLAPQDYHRFHIPVNGVIGTPTTISGTYFTVNPIAVNETIDVFTENKRVVTPIDSPEFGQVLFVAIGATMVGSVCLTTNEGQQVTKGEEHGYFAFGGSTVILLFPPDSITFDEDLVVNSSKPLETLVRMGDSLGKANH